MLLLVSPKVYAMIPAGRASGVPVRIILGRFDCLAMRPSFASFTLFLSSNFLAMANTSQENMPFDPYWSYPCAVCYRTITEIYEDTENQSGLKLRVSPHADFRIPRLWLTECGHLVCGKHLPGGCVYLLPFLVRIISYGFLMRAVVQCCFPISFLTKS
jgi:hypothetical protein